MPLLDAALGIGAAAASDVPTGHQSPIVVLTATEHPEDGNRPRAHIDGDDDDVRDHVSSRVVGEAKAGTEDFTRHTSEREERKGFAGREYRAGVFICDRR